MMKWLYKNWYKSTIFIAIYLIIILPLYLLKSDYAVFLIWLQFAVYLLHQFEEYILPGGFVKFFNNKVLQSDKDNYPLDDRASFWINIPIIFIAFPLSAILASCIDISIGIWTAYFSIINALSHVVMFFKHRYNPGFFVSLFLNIPVGTYTVFYFDDHGIISTNAQLIGLMIGVLIQAAVMIYGFKVLKPKVK
ncbi:MAG: HXXEE domain-containing protein [Winogradskyella sp.]|uniref:HXXEE domain-containing protein n=1 Tax=Winogradskyella sp. TaxID=1883156 RepID=UPI0025E32784|nr:HXXEE domain-containing protein [Winogradskyella sp.]NRB82607.1 HXXEE domain-containing protein [Winogradskyella sp.]